MEFLQSLFSNFKDALMAVLPLSPFKQFIQAFADIPYLSWLNWFIPFRGICVILSAWLAAVTLFYLYSIAMRWLKMIGD